MSVLFLFIATLPFLDPHSMCRAPSPPLPPTFPLMDTSLPPTDAHIQGRGSEREKKAVVCVRSEKRRGVSGNERVAEVV